MNKCSSLSRKIKTYGPKNFYNIGYKYHQCLQIFFLFLKKLECLCPAIFSSYELGSPTFSRTTLHRRECRGLLFLPVFVTVLIQIHLFCWVSFCWMSWHQERTSLTLGWKTLFGTNTLAYFCQSPFVSNEEKNLWINNIRNGCLE